MTSEVQKRQLVFKNWPIIDNLNWTSFRIRVGFIGGHEIVRFLIRFIPNHSFRLFEQTIHENFISEDMQFFFAVWIFFPLDWLSDWLSKMTRVSFNSFDRKWPSNFTHRLENQPRITKPQRVPISSFILYGSLFRIWKKLKSDCGCETTVELVGLFYLRQC